MQRMSAGFLHAALGIVSLLSGSLWAAPIEHQILAGQCVSITRERLHDPASATLPDANSPFDYPKKFYVGERRKGVITVQFDMRARNAYNALRLYTVDCEFKGAGGGFKLISYKNWQQR